MAFSSPPYNFSSDFQIELPTATATADLDLAMWGDNYNYYHAGVPVPNILECDHNVESPGSMTSFPDSLIGIFDMVVPTYLGSSMAENETDHINFNQYSQLLEGEYCCGLVSNFWPVYPPTADHNFEIKERTTTAKEVEEPTMKVGKYSVEERKDKIMKYLKKRNQRNFNKTIKYACRKTLADKRVRVRGRFAKNNEACEDQQHQTLRKNNYVHAEEPDLFYDGCVQMKQDYYEEEREEDWLELEAMESLLYSPCILMD